MTQPAVVAPVVARVAPEGIPGARYMMVRMLQVLSPIQFTPDIAACVGCWRRLPTVRGAAAGPAQVRHPTTSSRNFPLPSKSGWHFILLLISFIWAFVAIDINTISLCSGERGTHSLLYLDLSSANSADSASKLAAMRISSDSSSLRRCCCCFFFFLLSPTGRF